MANFPTRGNESDQLDSVPAPAPGPLHIASFEDFARVRDYFQRVEFNEDSLCKTLTIKDMSDLHRIDWTKVRMELLPKPLRWCLDLFVRGSSCSEQDSRVVCGNEIYASFLALGLIQPIPENLGHIVSTVWLYPVHGFLTASDRTGYLDGELPSAPQDVVFPAIYPGTLEFLKLLPDPRGGQALDLCGGTGIGALVLSRRARLAISSDVTKRAASFAEFNARLNDVPAASLCGDLYCAVKDQQFDVITAHPPFVPAAGRTMIFRDARETGEDVIRDIVEGLPAHLRVGGTCLIRCAARDTEVPFEQRAREWLSPAGEQFDFIFGLEKTSTPEDIVDSIRQRLLQGGDNEPQRLLDRLRGLGTRQYVHGALFIRRTAEPVKEPPLRLRMLDRATAADFDRVFEWRRWSRDPRFSDWMGLVKARPAPELRLSIRHVVTNDELVPRDYVFLLEGAFQNQLHLDWTVAPAVLRLNGARTVEDVFQSCQTEGIFPKGASLTAFIDLLRLMVERGFLQTDMPPKGAD